MEIKASLQKPYTNNQRMDFIIIQNHKLGYEIQETESELQAWGYTEEEIEQAERERLDNLSLTGSDVERAIYADKGMDFNDLIEYVKVHAPTIDTKALKIELGANDFFRKHPYINQIGKLLGYTSDDLDYLFENKVLPVKEVINESETNNSETVSEQGE